MLNAVVSVASLLAAMQAQSVTPYEPQAFRSQVIVEIEAPIDEVFDAATGDVKGWWDHSFALDPAEMVIEPVFGGRFYERFEEGADDGALHATIIYVDRPTRLTMNGPLGLSRRAVDLVSAWTLRAVGDDATEFTVDLSIVGEVDADLANAVTSVWDHFIRERLKAYVEADCHLAPADDCAAFADE